MNTSATSSQDILMLFNLHRLFIIKKKRLLILYSIAIPLMLIGPILDAYDCYPIIQAGQDVDLFYRHGQIPVLATVIIICYVKLKHEFATNQNFSEKTKRLQQKLSWSIMMQLILLCAIAVLISVIPESIKAIRYDLYLNYMVNYTIYSLVLTKWYPFLSAVFIAWSIAGFFKNNSSPPTTKQHSDVKIFQVEPQKNREVAARKMSTLT
ncbi:hypothetical protein L5515_009948 [Caenorhabditis briggsae]|uniref:Uncharacterized protein n=1 Tax=Caenorhabditis briggsae TaxID=6238 RepID=A0AAE9F9G8_CAEBR|nr:hypothetical protein L5515_009948 [Caenorhabditis briggsae]